jgi:pathogenesis-related protein 1
MVLLAWSMAVLQGCGGDAQRLVEGAVTADEVPPSMQPMLQAHQTVRAQVGSGPLAWSAVLARYAQQWADHLAADGCRMVHRSAAGADVRQAGENLYWASAVRWSDGRREIQAVAAHHPAESWASERGDYDVASNTCTPGRMCGHYTQMVWSTTRFVGCGARVCPDKGQIWVCNYDPPGNWVGQRPY